LFDALAVEYMVAFGLDGILRNITAESTDGGFASLIGAQKLACVGLAAEHKIWVASHLPHASEPARASESYKVRVQMAYKLKMLE
jgi:hypothetical protein